MNYDLMVTGYRKKSARMVVARHLAQTPPMSLQKALLIAETLPVTLFTHVPQKDISRRIAQFSLLGITLCAQESKPEEVNAVSRKKEDQLPYLKLHKELRSMLPALNPGFVEGKRIEGKNSKPADLSHSIVPRNSPAKRTWLSFAIVFLAVTCFIGGMLLFSRPTFKDRQIRSVPGKLFALNTGIKKNQDLLKKATNPPMVQQAKSDASRPEKKELALHCIDSAEAKSDSESAIKFYKMAIAFNKRNIHAWYGLVEAYRKAGRTEEMEQTLAEINELFDESALSVEKLVRPFGKILDYQVAEGGVVSVEYRTRRSSQEELTQETFVILRELRNVCNCNAISLFASKTAGSGMMVHVSARAILSTVEEFKSVATINYFASNKKNSRPDP